jgi:hypothetical protein
MKAAVPKAAALAVGVALVVLAVAATAKSASEAEAARQRVSIQAKEREGASAGRFSFWASGSLGLDTGKVTWTASERPRIVRDGQRIEVWSVVDTFTGRRGTFTIRERVEVVDAANGYLVGTGSWSFVRGTGSYAGASGRGRVATVRTPSGVGSTRFEGFLQSGS